MKVGGRHSPAAALSVALNRSPDRGLQHDLGGAGGERTLSSTLTNWRVICLLLPQISTFTPTPLTTDACVPTPP
jgi:hypothetical protein